MSQWDQGALARMLDRHLEIANGKQVVALFTPAGRSRFGAFITNRYASHPGVRLCDVGAEAHVPGDDPSVVALIAGSFDDAREAYAALGELKGRGLPVVFAQPERALSLSPPDWRTSGVQYEGMFYLAAQYATTIRPAKGAYCEFGVYDGRSFVLAGHALKDVLGTFVAFDSYQGLGGTREDERTHFKDAMYSANIQTLHYNLAYAGLATLNYRAIPGFFRDTLHGRTSQDDGIGPISIAHIDVDIYEPALMALEYVTGDLSDGALLMFDDFDQLAASNSKGERRALREWLANHPEIEVEPYRNYGVFCRAFIVHRL